MCVCVCKKKLILTANSKKQKDAEELFALNIKNNKEESMFVRKVK